MHWDNLHEEAFDHVKATIALEVVLAYPDFSKPFEIYTYASDTQKLGSVITQDNRPQAFLEGSCQIRKHELPKLNY